MWLHISNIILISCLHSGCSGCINGWKGGEGENPLLEPGHFVSMPPLSGLHVWVAALPAGLCHLLWVSTHPEITRLTWLRGCVVIGEGRQDRNLLFVVKEVRAGTEEVGNERCAGDHAGWRPVSLCQVAQVEVS